MTDRALAGEAVATERDAFNALQRSKLRSHWLYNNPNGHQLVDLMLTVIPEGQNRAGEYVDKWIQVKWRGWLECAEARSPLLQQAVEALATSATWMPNDHRVRYVDPVLTALRAHLKGQP